MLPPSYVTLIGRSAAKRETVVTCDVGECAVEGSYLCAVLERDVEYAAIGEFDAGAGAQLGQS